MKYVFGYKIKELGANHKEYGFPEVKSNVKKHFTLFILFKNQLIEKST